MKWQLGVWNSPPKLAGVPARPSNSRKGRAGGVVPEVLLAGFGWGTTPSAPSFGSFAAFLDGAATPPNLGGESSRPSIHSHLNTGGEHPFLIAFALPTGVSNPGPDPLSVRSSAAGRRLCPGIPNGPSCLKHRS